MSKKDKQELRQQIACEWLQENYLQFGHLRHDVVTDRLTTAEISERLVTFGGIKKPMALNRLGTVLSGIGYRSVSRRVGGTKTRRWIVYQRDTGEMNALKRLLAQ